MACTAILLWVFRVLSYDWNNMTSTNTVDFEGKTWAVPTDDVSPCWKIPKKPTGKVWKRMKHTARKLLRANAKKFTREGMEFQLFGSNNGRRVKPIDFTDKRFFLCDYLYGNIQVICPLTAKTFYRNTPMNVKLDDDIEYGEPWFVENFGTYFIISGIKFKIQYPVIPNVIKMEFKLKTFGEYLDGEPIAFKCDDPYVLNKAFCKVLNKNGLSAFASTIEQINVSNKQISILFEKSSACAMTAYTSAVLIWDVLLTNYIITADLNDEMDDGMVMDGNYRVGFSTQK